MSEFTDSKLIDELSWIEKNCCIVSVTAAKNYLGTPAQIMSGLNVKQNTEKAIKHWDIEVTWRNMVTDFGNTMIHKMSKNKYCSSATFINFLSLTGSRLQPFSNGKDGWSRHSLILTMLSLWFQLTRAADIM